MITLPVVGSSVRSVLALELISSGNCVADILLEAFNPATPDAWFLPLITLASSSNAVFKSALAAAGESVPASA